MSSMSLIYKYGLFPPGGYKVAVLAKTEKEAKKYKYGKYRYYEVRKIIQ